MTCVDMQEGDEPLVSMNLDDVRLFALDSSRDYGRKIAAALGILLSEHEEREFEDGEHKSRPLINVRGKDVFVVQSLHGDEERNVSEKLCRLLFFVGALKDAAAASVTAVVPYLCYARKDRKTQPRDPVTSRYVAALLEAAGTDRVVTLDVHNLAAFQNAFRCRTDHLEARKIFVRYFASILRGNVVVVSPDAGGIKRAELFRTDLGRATGKEIPVAFMEKKRAKGVVSGETMVGDIDGRSAIILDDLISTGTTLARAATACRENGALAVYAAASHGLFVGGASRLFESDAIAKVVVTDTVPPFRLPPRIAQDKLVVLDAAALFAEAIRRIHTGGSIVDLLQA